MLRIGFDPRSTALEARERVYKPLLTAANTIPPALFGEGRAEGKKEALRQFLYSTLQPLGDMIAGEARENLTVAFSLGFDRLYAADIQDRARAYKSQVDGGRAKAEAARKASMADGHL